MVENISSVYFNDWKSIFTIFVNGSRPLKFSAWFKKKHTKGEGWKPLPVLKLVREQNKY